MYSLDDALIRLEELTDEELLVVLATFLEEQPKNLKRDYSKRSLIFNMIIYLLTMDVFDDDEIDLQNERIEMIMEKDWSDYL